MFLIKSKSQVKSCPIWILKSESWYSKLLELRSSVVDGSRDLNRKELHQINHSWDEWKHSVHIPSLPIRSYLLLGKFDTQGVTFRLSRKPDPACQAPRPTAYLAAFRNRVWRKLDGKCCTLKFPRRLRIHQSPDCCSQQRPTSYRRLFLSPWLAHRWRGWMWTQLWWSGEEFIQLFSIRGVKLSDFIHSSADGVPRLGIPMIFQCQCSSVWAVRLSWQQHSMGSCNSM